MRSRTAFPMPWFLLAFGLLGVLLVIAGIRSGSAAASDADTTTVQRADFEEWIPLSARLEAANPITFRAELDGVSKLTYLAEDGTPVAEGEVIARFDRSDLEERKRTLTRDLEIANATFTSLREAEHPLELLRLEQDLRTVQTEIQKETLLRKETRALVEEDLLAPEELEIYNQNLASLQARLDGLQQQLDLTTRVLHPAAVGIARARQVAARAGLENVEKELASTVVRAPAEGTVHLPLIPIDGERRPPRVGDGLYRNQVYLELANLTDLVIRAEVGERLLARVVPGMEAMVHFPALPERTERARVASVGAYPRGSQRQYPVELQWDHSPTDLRPGLTASVQVLSQRLEDVLVVPRSFLDWQGPTLSVMTPGGRKIIDPGPGNPQEIVVRSGLEAGEVLIRP